MGFAKTLADCLDDVWLFLHLTLGFGWLVSPFPTRNFKDMSRIKMKVDLKNRNVRHQFLSNPIGLRREWKNQSLNVIKKSKQGKMEQHMVLSKRQHQKKNLLKTNVDIKIMDVMVMVNTKQHALKNVYIIVST